MKYRPRLALQVLGVISTWEGDSGHVIVLDTDDSDCESGKTTDQNNNNNTNIIVISDSEDSNDVSKRQDDVTNTNVIHGRQDGNRQEPDVQNTARDCQERDVKPDVSNIAATSIASATVTGCQQPESLKPVRMVVNDVQNWDPRKPDTTRNPAPCGLLLSRFQER